MRAAEHGTKEATEVVCVHLDHVREPNRLSELAKLVEYMRALTTHELTHRVWMGDFNYHISTEVEAEDCCMAIAGVRPGGMGQGIPTGKSSWEPLGPHDEMRKEMEGGHVYYAATAVPA